MVDPLVVGGSDGKWWIPWKIVDPVEDDGSGVRLWIRC